MKKKSRTLFFLYFIYFNSARAVENLISSLKLAASVIQLLLLHWTLLGRRRVKAINQQKTLLNKEGPNKKSGRKKSHQKEEREGGGGGRSSPVRHHAQIPIDMGYVWWRGWVQILFLPNNINNRVPFMRFLSTNKLHNKQRAPNSNVTWKKYDTSDMIEKAKLLRKKLKHTKMPCHLFCPQRFIWLLNNDCNHQNVFSQMFCLKKRLFNNQDWTINYFRFPETAWYNHNKCFQLLIVIKLYFSDKKNNIHMTRSASYYYYLMFISVKTVVPSTM